MIKWPITYTDYNGEQHVEDFYFNLNKAEIMELNLSANGAYGDYLKRIVDQRDGKAMVGEFKMLILKSYGEKTDDGRHFIKSDERTQLFEQSEAYSELFMQLCTDPEACAKFVNGIFPADFAEAAKNANEQGLALA